MAVIHYERRCAMRLFCGLVVALLATVTGGPRAFAQHQQWARTVPGMTHGYAGVQAYELDNKGNLVPSGFIVVGKRYDRYVPPYNQGVIVKLTNEGELDWGPVTFPDGGSIASDVEAINDANGTVEYVVFGTLGRSPYVMRLSTDGTVRDEKLYGFVEAHYFPAVHGIYLEDKEPEGQDKLLMVFTYEDTYNNSCRPSAGVTGLKYPGLDWMPGFSREIRWCETMTFSLEQTLDDGFILAGQKFLPGCPWPGAVVNDAFAEKLRGDLSTEARKAFGDGCAARDYEGFRSARELVSVDNGVPEADGFVMAGIKGVGNQALAWIVRTDQSLVTTWELTFGDEYGYDAVQSRVPQGGTFIPGDGVILASQSSGYMRLRKFDTNDGVVVWQTEYREPDVPKGYATSLTVTDDAGFLGVGVGPGGAWVTKLGPEGALTNAEGEIEVVDPDGNTHTIEFPGVLVPGTTTVETVPPDDETPPANFRFGNDVFFSVTTTATVQWPATVCLNLTGLGLTKNFEMRHRPEGQNNWGKVASPSATCEYPSDEMRVGATCGSNNQCDCPTRGTKPNQEASVVVEACGDVYSFSDFAILVALNEPPVADAGPDQVLLCSSGDGTAGATLDGSGSSDPDGDELIHLWSENTASIAEGAVVDAFFTLGDHLVTLTVDDGQETDSDELVVTVEATLAGLEALTRAYIASGDLETRVGNALLESICEAMTKVAKGMPDKAEGILEQYIDRLDRELAKGNVSAAAAAELIGAAECAIGFAL